MVNTRLILMIKTIKENIILENKFFKVENNNVLFKNGKQGEHLKITSKPTIKGIAVLAINKDLDVVIQDEYRYAVEKYVTQVVKGGVLENQSHEKAVEMELEEELGLTTNKIVYIGDFVEDPSIMAQDKKAFIAFNCEVKVDSKNDGTESFSNRRTVKFSILIDEVMNNKISCAVTQMMILKANQILNEM
jgi:3-deoxy-D-manno-octulosonate 8-phosphate phosphatase KdsC-like HAD superfamily phosphatase